MSCSVEFTQEPRYFRSGLHIACSEGFGTRCIKGQHLCIKSQSIVSFCRDCQSGLYFCLLSRPKRLDAHAGTGLSFASFGSSLGLPFGLTALGAIDGFVLFSVM